MRLKPLALCVALLCGNAQADLLQAWSDALTHDAGYQNALAERDFGTEEYNLALAQLLPQISVNATQGKARTDISQSSQSVFRKYDTESWAIQLRQSIFRARALAGYQRGEALAEAADARLIGARQSLLSRLLEAAAQLAIADANIAASTLSISTATQVLNVSARQLRAGEMTRRDQIRARSRLAQAKQDLSAARTEKAAASANWSAITGQATPPRFRLPDDLSLRLQLSDTDLDTLVAQALAHNPVLKAARSEVQAARHSVRQAQGDRLPTVDLVASRSFSDSDTDNTIGSAFDTTRIMLQASLPLFSGGSISAAVRQAQARLRGAQATLNDLTARAKLTLMRDTAGLVQAQSETERALADRETGLVEQRSAELGKLAGTATVVDIADAETLKARAQRDLVQANANALLAWARVHDALGQLDAQKLQVLNTTAGWD